MTIQAEEMSKVFRGNSIVQSIILGIDYWRKKVRCEVNNLSNMLIIYRLNSTGSLRWNNHQRNNITSQDKRSSCSQRYLSCHLFHLPRIQMILRIEDSRARNAQCAYHYHQGTLKETLFAFFQALFHVIPCVKTIVKREYFFLKSEK